MYVVCMFSVNLKNIFCIIAENSIFEKSNMATKMVNML